VSSVTFYRIKRGLRLHGFGDAIGEVPLLGKPLLQWQNEAVAAAGGICKEVEAGSFAEVAVFFGENIFLSAAAAKLLAAQAIHATSTATQQGWQLALQDNAFNQRFALPPARSHTGIGWDIWIGQWPGSTDAATWTLPQKSYANWVDLPKQVVREGRYHLDQCDACVFAIDTPFHLLQANMALNLNRHLPLRRRLPAFLERQQAYLHTRLYFAAMRWTSRLGKHCKIHPTAVIEGSVLGDGVTVGAYAVVRNSMVGDGTTIEDQASVIQCVLGKNNYLANKNHLCLCLTYDNVYSIHGPYQFSVFGRGSSAFAVINCDVRMDGASIRIPSEIGLMDSQQPLLGLAYGHGSKVAAGNVIAPGRIIPNDTLVAPPESLLPKGARE
jgi:hypothetical protein